MDDGGSLPSPPVRVFVTSYYKSSNFVRTELISFHTKVFILFESLSPEWVAMVCLVKMH